MTLFYWGQPDELGIQQGRRLFVVDINESGTPMVNEVHGSKMDVLVALIGNGATEISYVTAYQLAWPI